MVFLYLIIRNEHNEECKSIINLLPYKPPSLVLFLGRILRLIYGNIKRKNNDIYNKIEYAKNMVNHLSEVNTIEMEEISELSMVL